MIILKSLDNKIYYRDWPCNDPKAAVILLHDLGGYAERFSELGRYLSENGIKAYAVELRGFGDSPYQKGHIGGFKAFTDDLLSLISSVKKEDPDKKIFLLGESLGGLIALNFCIGHQKLIDGAMLISPAIRDKLPISLGKRIGIAYNAIFTPMNYHYAFFEAKLFTRDQEMMEKTDSDPLELRSFSARTFLQVFLTMIHVGKKAREIELPTLMLLAGQDKMVSTEASASYFKKIASKDKALKTYPDMYHALSIDKGREKVFEEIVGWINEHC